MSTSQTVKAQIQSLIDLANTTTGNQDTNLTDGVNALVEGFGKGDIELPDDMLEGLENGYDVMFYDEFNKGLAFYSVKQGHGINPPIYNCKNWQTSDGTNATFPYTPSADVIFYALNSTYSDQLYEHFGVDKGICPYVMIYIVKNSSTVYSKQVRFIKEIVSMGSSFSLDFKGGFVQWANDSTVFSPSSETYFDDLFNYIMSLEPSLVTEADGTRYTISWSGYTAFINGDDYATDYLKNMDEQ